MDTESYFCWVKSPSSDEIKNAWCYTSTLPSVFMPWCLNKHRDNFTSAWLVVTCCWIESRFRSHSTYEPPDNEVRHISVTLCSTYGQSYVLIPTAQQQWICARPLTQRYILVLVSSGSTDPQACGCKGQLPTTSAYWVLTSLTCILALLWVDKVVVMVDIIMNIILKFNGYCKLYN
jgi:hypothetical protein